MLFKIIDGWKKAPLAVFGVYSLIIAAPSFFLGPFSYLRSHDFGEQHFSHYKMLSKTIFDYGIHYWHLSAGGADLLSNNMRFIDIFFALFVLFPPWFATALLIVSSNLLGSYFMYVILRDHVRLEPWAAIFGGIFFPSFYGGGFSMMEHFFGLAGLPFFIWGLSKLVSRSWLLAHTGAAFLGIMYALGAYLHITGVFILPLVYGWLLVYFRAFYWRITLLVLTSTIFMFLAQLDMISALALNVPLSHRADWVPPNRSLWSVIMMVFEPLYLFLLIGLLSAKTRNSWGLFFIGITLAWIGILTAEDSIRTVIGSYINLLKGFNFAHVLDIKPFLYAACAAWGLNKTMIILRGSRVASLRAIPVSSILLVSSLCIAMAPLISGFLDKGQNWIKLGSYKANWGSPVIQQVVSEFKESEIPFRVATIQENGLQAAYANAYGLETADGYLNVVPKEYKSFWRMVIEPYLHRNPEKKKYFENHGSRLGLWTDDGHSVHLNVEEYFRPHLLALLNVRYILTTVPLEHPALILLNSTKPEIYWDELSRDSKLAKRLHENFKGRDVMVYRLNEELPRWFLAKAIRTYSSEEELHRGLVNASSDELRNTVWLNESANFTDTNKLTPSSLNGRIVKSHYSPDRILLNVDLAERGFLVVSNVFSPFWQLSVNGRKAKILKAYGALWAVKLNQGKHEVEFTYKPPYAIFN